MRRDSRPPEPEGPTGPSLPAIVDDRDHVQSGDRSIFIIEDDPTFAGILLECARAEGWKGIVTAFGDTTHAMMRKYRPSAITLDLGLPDIDGWTVLDRLKHDGETRHVPVQIISGAEDRQRARRMGAFGFLEKPATRAGILVALRAMATFVEKPVKRLLLVEDDPRERKTLTELIGDRGVETFAVGTGAEALDLLGKHEFRCMVLDLGLPDMPGFEVLKRIKGSASLRDLPVVVYTGRELSKKEETQLRRLSETIVIKDVRSPERLLDETALFLHRAETDLPEAQRQMLRELHHKVPELAGHKVLVVDDDIRNIFAVSSALELHGVNVCYAENGKEGLEMLQKTPGIEAVLMDIMMPELDGYEVMRRIRTLDDFKTLPIIALTAKAMRTDRDKCIQAGASDYIAKPVDMERLLSMLRVWLTR